MPTPAGSKRSTLLDYEDLYSQQHWCLQCCDPGLFLKPPRFGPQVHRSSLQEALHALQRTNVTTLQPRLRLLTKDFEPMIYERLSSSEATKKFSGSLLIDRFVFWEVKAL